MPMSLWQKVTGITSSDIFRNSAKLLSASFIVQVIGLLVYPILTRLYSPEDFGLINLFFSISGVLALFATAEFQYSILLPKYEERAVACFHIGFIIAIVVFLALLWTVPFSDSIAQLFKAPNLAEWYWAIPIFVLLSAIWTLLNYWYTRQKQFGEISKYQVTQCLTNAGAKCGFGFAGILNGGLIYSAIISPFIALSISLATINKKYIKPLFTINRFENAQTIREYSNFPKYSLPRALVNYLSGNLPIFLLTPIFGLTEIGYFGMALTLAFKPINMISNSLYQVFFQKTSKQVQNKEHIIGFFRKYILLVSVIAIPLLIVIGIFMLEDGTQFLLGQQWGKTGTTIFIMLPWLITSCLVAPICYLSDIFLKQKIGLVFEILLILARLGGLYLGIYLDTFYGAIFFYSFASGIVIGFQLCWYVSLIKNYERSIAEE